jgi:hypothetical protein
MNAGDIALYDGEPVLIVKKKVSYNIVTQDGMEIIGAVDYRMQPLPPGYVTPPFSMQQPLQQPQTHLLTHVSVQR